MKTNVKIIVAALCTAGLIAPPLAMADTISSPAVAPVAQSVVPGTYTVTYPVTVALAGGAPQSLNFVYNSNGTWTAPAGWTFNGYLNPSNNTAVFTTGSGATAYGVSLSSTGQTQFNPGQTGAVTTPPSFGTAPANTPVTGTALPGWGAATATGTVVGKGQTSATLVGAGAVAQIIGVGQGGAPVGTVAVGAPIAVNPASATSAVGNAAGSVVVNSNQANNSVGYGSYTVTIPQTNTPNPTAAVSGTVAGNGAAFGAANGLNIGTITGTASYNPNTGVITATPVFTAGFSVNPSGNTQIGCAGANTGTTANLTVCNQTFTNGITDTGGIATFGNLTVGGQTSTAGLANSGQMSTNTLVVVGGSATNGIANTGNISTTTLGVTGNATINGTVTAANIVTTGSAIIGGSLTSNGIVNTGNVSTTGNATIGGNTTVGGTLGVTGATTLSSTLAVSGNTTVGGTLGVTGATTLSGATQINNTLNVTGASTLGGSGTSGNQLTVGVNGVLMSAGGVTGNSVGVNSTGAQINGGGAGLVFANNRATFGTTSGGAPLRVTGIADGQNQYDAVNFGQFQELEKDMSRGISGTAAMANIPQVDQGKSFSVGVGVGGFNGETAVAIGGSARVAKDGILKASVGFSGSGNTTWGVGGGWNW